MAYVDTFLNIETSPDFNFFLFVIFLERERGGAEGEGQRES